MIQQHRLELIFAGPRKQLDELMPKVMAAMDGHAGRLHLDAIDLNDLAHKVGAVAQLSWEHRAEMYNILPQVTSARARRCSVSTWMSGPSSVRRICFISCSLPCRSGFS